ncbi:MAG: hypothetical protein IK016_00825, partial [Lachnospiraceae bacterium]|nr:hypothetical protein [Lachnospiraceae bacterium]
MDREEYRLRTDEIKSLVREQRFPEAARIADSIDWKKVKSARMLAMIGDLYKITGKFQKSRNAMLLAYDRDPSNPDVVYSLCELAIRLGDFIGAIEYMKEYVRLAPGESGRFVLQYKLYEAQGVGMDERAELLEQLKAQDYKPRWVYELAQLYAGMGDGQRAVAQCDEIYETLGQQSSRNAHKYVLKALELKRRFVPLDNVQEAYYNSAMAAARAYEEPAQQPAQDPYAQAAQAQGAAVQDPYAMSSAYTTATPVGDARAVPAHLLGAAAQ